MKLIWIFTLILSALTSSGAYASDWSNALALGEKGKNQQAYQLLEKILNSKQDTISKDEILMNMARVKYQEGKFSEAHTLYSKISKDSDYWLQSLEEQAWTYLREYKYEKALAEYQTLTTPAFAPQVGPETYLIGTFAALKICDYNSIFEIFKDFKTKFKDLSVELTQLSKTGDSPAVQRALSKLKANSFTSWADLGPDVSKLPQFLNRDVQLNVALQTGQNAKVKSRLKELAARDLKILTKIVQKLRIVELEAIQRMNLTQTRVAVFNHDAEPNESDTISFPKEKEVWLDEVDKYHVKAKGCQLKLGAK